MITGNFETNSSANRLYPVFGSGASFSGHNTPNQNNQFGKRLAAVKAQAVQKQSLNADTRSLPTSSRISAASLAASFAEALPKTSAISAPSSDPLDNTYLGWGWHEDAIFGQAGEEQIAA